MCGIFLSPSRDKHTLISHRGTEHRSVPLKGDWELHHYRLPIQTEPSDDWRQPILVDNWVIAYNGEIFSYDLNKYENDVEFLVELFRIHSPVTIAEQLSKHDGFYSVVAIDTTNNDVFCFTDPLGRKQLYYNSAGEVCSEIFPIARGAFDETYFQKVGAFGYCEEIELTPFDQVKQVPRGRVVVLHLGEEVNHVHYLPYRVLESSEIEQPLFDKIKTSCIRRQTFLKGHVKTGVFLSGGLDSSVIAYHLLELDPIFYTIENDEDYKYIRLLEKTWGIRVQAIPLLYNEASLVDIITANDSPVDLGSMIPQYLLFKEAAKRSCKVVLTGDGADELFGGYRRAAFYNSFQQDMVELSSYHLPRLDRMSMRFTIEARSPWLATPIWQNALNMPWTTAGKTEIKKSMYKQIPKQILDRKKLPLKSGAVRTDEKTHRYEMIDKYKQIYRQNEVWTQ